MTHVAEMPPPADLVARIKDANPPPRPPSGGGGAQAASSGAEAVARHAARMSSGTGASGGIQAALAQEPDAALARFPSFARVVDLITANRDQLLKVEVETGVRLVSYRPGRIEFEPSPQAAPDLAQKLGQRLQSWTGVRWAVSVVADGGQPTIAEVRDAEKAALESEARANPLVASIFDAFPQGKLKTIETPAQLAAKATTEALGEVEEEWDPFEDG
jgi:DNA polymerase-3 subunit gamma/tau